MTPDLVPEYVDSRLIDNSPWNARTLTVNLESLMESIRVNGLLQPIIVRIAKKRFEVVAGNRRLEACKRLHWVRIPCLIRDFTDKEAFEIGLVENIERKTLSPVEEAIAFQKYAQKTGWGGVTELARAIGRSKEYVSHRMSLLKLPADVLDLISTEKIAPSSGHELIWMKNPNGQRKLARALVGKNVPTIKVREAVNLFREGMEMDSVLESMEQENPSKQNNAATAPERKAFLKNRKYTKLLDKSILCFRICMVRMDSLIEELETGENEDLLRQLLIKKRLLIHNQINDLIQLKRSYAATA